VSGTRQLLTGGTSLLGQGETQMALMRKVRTLSSMECSYEASRRRNLALLLAIAPRIQCIRPPEFISTCYTFLDQSRRIVNLVSKFYP
jgi:hypothetical protein